MNADVLIQKVQLVQKQMENTMDQEEWQDVEEIYQ
jgi:hypothetical protein